MEQKQIKSKIAEGYIYARIILEIVGKPKDHVESSLKEYIGKIKADTNYAVVKEDSEKAEAQGDLYSAFAEMELLIKDSLSLLSFCFDYMPSSVEIIEPEKIIVTNNEFGGFINDMLTRSHALNAGVLEMGERNKYYVKNTAILLRNFIVVLLSSKPMTIEKMSPYLGVKEEDIKKVIDVLLKEKKIKKEGNKYLAVETQK